MAGRVERLQVLRGVGRQEALEKHRNLWGNRRAMDYKPGRILRASSHHLSVEIAWQFFPVVAHKLELDIAPGLDRMVRAHLAVFG
jgi:hypothetical protein